MEGVYASSSWTTCTSPDSLTGLTEGSHTFSVRAIDATGNTDPTPASQTWKVDLTNPSATLAAQPPNVSGTVTLNGGASDNLDSSPVVTYQFKTTAASTWTSTGSAW